MNEHSRTILFNISALLILAGTVLVGFQLLIAPYLFAVGAAGMALCHFTYNAKKLNTRQKRLQRFNVLGSILLIAASALMFKGRNEWILCLTIAAVFMTYAAFIPEPKDKN
ncbi:MAG: hypothetical protein LIP01_15510 [Tannerellaceae bacterium]|nr:hypothetical protein [Tannerellaceae bacterium]